MASFFLNSTFLLWQQEKREQFPSLLAILTIFLGTIFELSIYWFTSKALGENLANFGNYFQYVVTGQIVLFLPLHLLSTFSLGLRESRNFGTLDAIFLLPMNLERKILYCAWGPILRNLVHLALFVALAVTCFEYRLDWQSWLWLGLYQILFFPLFIGLGFLSAGGYLYFGRGIGFFQMVTQAVALLSGVYFPTQVFPYLQNLAAISPFHLILDLSRGTQAIHGWAWIVFLAWSLLALLLAPIALRVGYTRMRRRGKLEFTHQI
jgi:hypothetical protein